MRVKVKTMRKAGKNLHKGDLALQPPFMGQLRVKEEHDPVLQRQVLRARLVDISRGTEHDILPTLTDARLIHAADGKLTLIGTERVDLAEYGQTWAVELA
jgi:hypothetical protein